MMQLKLFCLFVSGDVELVFYLTTLFIGKPLRGSLPVLCADSFASN